MENINIAELLKGCPEGMELDCTMFKKPVKYMGLTEDETYMITIKTSGDKFFFLTKEGYLYDTVDSKCIIFPKGNTTWEGFQGPFKDGDVVATCDSTWIGITTGGEKERLIPTYCVIKGSGKFEVYFDKKERWAFNRCATEEEKAKLFQAIKDNGYKWNPYTKTLDKLIEPSFKVGDKVRHKNNHGVVFTITSIEEDSYVCGAKAAFWFDDQDDYELVPNKFDITTLKPFDKVLARDTDNSMWTATLFSHLRGMTFYTVGGWYNQCIPYEGNEHLLGKCDDCDEYYKTWE